MLAKFLETVAEVEPGPEQLALPRLAALFALSALQDGEPDADGGGKRGSMDGTSPPADSSLPEGRCRGRRRPQGADRPSINKSWLLSNTAFYLKAANQTPVF